MLPADIDVGVNVAEATLAKPVYKEKKKKKTGKIC